MDRSLARLAAAYGVATEYQNWKQQRVEVPRDTVVAVLGELGVDVSSPSAIRAQSARVAGRAATAARPPARPSAGNGGGPAGNGAARPPRRWGLMAQLYSVRSRRSWGFGDLRDLADLAEWSGRELGAAFVLVNPLHAGQPVPPIQPSPYMPCSRRFVSPLYLRIEDVPEYAALPAADRERIEALAEPMRARNHTLDTLDRDAVWQAKQAALELVHRVPRTAERQAAYQAFRADEGDALTGFATWSALTERHGADWRRWPGRLRDPSSPAVARESVPARVDFHAWLQWLLAEQLATAQRAARDAGMSIGVIHDMAVGVDPGGADGWLYQDVLAGGIHLGAPPDEFNQRGQDWGLPPWQPVRLAEAEYAPYRDLIRATLCDAGGLRVDHVIGMFRQWWVPPGASPAEGTYVRCDHERMIGVLTEEAAKEDAVIIGEDLGVVEPWVHDYLPERGVLGTSMLWFEREPTGRPSHPERWRERCLATVATHDLPPIAGYLNADHVELRERLGLLTRSVAEECAELERQLTQWRELLTELDLLPLSARPGLCDMTVALHAFLARTPAQLIGVSLADAVGERRTQNQPGTSTEYPNWQIPLADAAGRPVLLDDLPTNPWVRAVVAPVRSATLD